MDGRFFGACFSFWHKERAVAPVDYSSTFATAPLAYVVKSRVRDSYNKQDEYKYSHDLYDGIITTVREEIQELSMKMIGTMISGSKRVNENVMQSISFEEDKLPEKSEELPIGALDFLE